MARRKTFKPDVWIWSKNSDSEGFEHIDTGFVEFEFIPVFGESFLEGSGHRLYQ
jgi:hypothetical protein